MKKITILLLTLIVMISAPMATAQYLEQIIHQPVTFDIQGAQSIFIGQYDVLKYWHPQDVLGTALNGSDSMWVIDVVGSLYQSADSGAVAVQIGFTNVPVELSAGFVGTDLDTMIIPADTCCNLQGSSFLTPVKYHTFFKDFFGAADSIAMWTSQTANRTEAAPSATGRHTTANPKKYMIVKVTSTAANSAYNRIYLSLFAKRAVGT